MGVFDDDIATAKELIDEFGQNCYWQKPAPIVNATPGYPTVGTLPDPVLCKIVFFSPKDVDRGTAEWLAHMAGGEVPINSQVGLMAGGITFTPELPDTIRRGSVDAAQTAIKRIDLLAPDGTPVLYTIVVAA